MKKFTCYDFIYHNMAASNEFDFTPDARGTLENMKFGGINVSQICQEFIDNSIDSLSKRGKVSTGNVDIYLYGGEENPSKFSKFCIIDNASGMTKDGMLHACRHAHRHTHDKEKDIGKFGVGLHNASIGLGNEICISSKTDETPAVGVFFNITDMKHSNTFNPTQFAEDGFELRGRHPSAIWKKFTTQKSGTIISVSSIHSHHSHDIEQLAKDIVNKINFNYTQSPVSVRVHVIYMLENDRFENKSYDVSETDLFYKKNRSALESLYETTLLYSNGTVYERLENKRLRGNETINGSPNKPTYFKFNLLTKGSHKNSNKIHERIDKSPDEFETLRIRFIEVKKTSYDSESKMPEWEGLDNRRNGFFFNRGGKRIVGSCLSLGEKIHSDGYSNHLRMEVIFPATLDLQIGVRTQKQMSENLPSIPISDALRTIWHQLAKPIIDRVKAENKEKKRQKNQKENNDSDSSDDSDSEEEKSTKPNLQVVDDSDSEEEKSNKPNLQVVDDSDSDEEKSTKLQHPSSQPKPAEAKPAEAKPAEAKPAEAKPAEAKPAEAKPAEEKSAEEKSTKLQHPLSQPKQVDYISMINHIIKSMDNSKLEKVYEYTKNL